MLLERTGDSGRGSMANLSGDKNGEGADGSELA
jgi:hypothetical protein